MNSTSTVALNANPSLAKKQRVSYKLYQVGTSKEPKTLFSGSLKAYQHTCFNFEEQYHVFQGSPFQLMEFLQTAPYNFVVHRETWDSSLRGRKYEPFNCKRAIGDYPRSEMMYQAEVVQAPVRKYED